MSSCHEALAKSDDQLLSGRCLDSTLFSSWSAGILELHRRPDFRCGYDAKGTHQDSPAAALIDVVQCHVWLALFGHVEDEDNLGSISASGLYPRSLSSSVSAFPLSHDHIFAGH